MCNRKPLRLAVICPSEIAIRRFMPALKKNTDFEFMGVGICEKDERGFSGSDAEFEVIRERQNNKAKVFTETYGGIVFPSFHAVVTSPDIDAVYIPLPPAQHFKWAKVALENGKHVLGEKPLTTSLRDTRVLAAAATDRKLALHENYMFVFHRQIEYIREVICSGEIGDVRLYRLCFGFPRRNMEDFRYNRELGGGALYDAAGYTIKYAWQLLGETASVKYAQLNYLPEFQVDMYGSGALVNEDGTTVQIAFGMDNAYKCELEAWGSKGVLHTNRVFTAPVGYESEITVSNGSESEVRTIPPDDAFSKSINYFYQCIINPELAQKHINEIIKQAELVDEFEKLAKGDK